MEQEQDEVLNLHPLVKTKLAWDLLPHNKMRDWLPRLGLTPSAEDVHDLEHKEAHARAATVEPIAELADIYAAIIADVQTVYLAHESGTTTEAQAEFTDYVFQLNRSAILAVLTEFLSDGILAYGPAIVRTTS